MHPLPYGPVPDSPHGWPTDLRCGLIPRNARAAGDAPAPARQASSCTPIRAADRSATAFACAIHLHDLGSSFCRWVPDPLEKRARSAVQNGTTEPGPGLDRASGLLARPADGCARIVRRELLERDPGARGDPRRGDPRAGNSSAAYVPARASERAPPPHAGGSSRRVSCARACAGRAAVARGRCAGTEGPLRSRRFRRGGRARVPQSKAREARPSRPCGAHGSTTEAVPTPARGDA
jgi:hypothetical protein